MAELDVVIIGGGISGLSCSKLLTEKGINNVVLEARERVGGRTWTVYDAAYGGYTDIGGAYVGPTQRRVARMVTEFGLKLYKVYCKGKSVLTLQGSRMVFTGDTPPLINPIIMLDLNNALQVIDKMAAEIPVATPWTAPKAAEWDKMTMQQCIDSICWTQFARDYLRVCYYHSLAASPNDISMLYALWYTINCQGLGRMINTIDGGQERKFVGGSMQLSTKMAEVLGDRVHLNEPVIRVEQSDDGVTVTTSTGNVYNARYVISAMPQALLNRVAFVPALLPEKVQLIQRMPMGQACKTMIFYDKPYWRDLGYSGETAGDKFPHSQSLDDTKPDGTAPCLIGFVVGDNCVKFMRLPVEERRRLVAQYYAEAFNCSQLLQPINYVDKSWMGEEYSGGCYVSALPPGTLTNFGHTIRAPYHRLYFAGTESGSHWAGYMEGAIQAGERAAREVLHAMGRIHACDIIVDEPLHPLLPEPPITYTLFQRSLPSLPTAAVCTAGMAAMLAAAEIKNHAISGIVRSLFARL